MAVGMAMMFSMSTCQTSAEASPCNDNRERAAVAGALIGAGAATAAIGVAITVGRFRDGPVLGVNLRF